jgi:hypothetical protein
MAYVDRMPFNPPKMLKQGLRSARRIGYDKGMARTRNNTSVLRGAKYGAIIAIVGGAVAMAIFTTLALLRIRVFGYLCVLEGSVLSNVIGATIAIAVLAVGGVIAGAVLGRVIGLLQRPGSRQTPGQNSRN